MRGQFATKAALVTGGDSGIGRAIDNAFVRAGVAAVELCPCTAGASFVSGHAHPVDGGRSI